MPSVLIVYASDYGNTKAMAEAITEGVTSVAGVTATLKTADEATDHDINALFFQRVGIFQHLISFSDTRRRADIQPEICPLILFQHR